MKLDEELDLEATFINKIEEAEMFDDYIKDMEVARGVKKLTKKQNGI